MTVAELTQRLDRIEAALDALVSKLDAILAPRSIVKKTPEARVRRELVVERYKACGSMPTVAHELGVSTQRVQQIISRWEKDNKTKLPRLKFVVMKKERVDWRCAGCGVVHRLTQAAVRARGGKVCSKCSKAQRRRFTDEQIEQMAQRITKQGRGRWVSLGAELGYPQNQSHTIQRIVFDYLYRRLRVADIEAIWRSGVPAWLEKRTQLPSLGKAA